MSDKAKADEFVVCPKCRWQHAAGTEECRFCGAQLETKAPQPAQDKIVPAKKNGGKWTSTR